MWSTFELPRLSDGVRNCTNFHSLLTITLCCFLAILWLVKEKKGKQVAFKTKQRSIPGPGNYLFGSIANVLALRNMKTALSVLDGWTRKYGPIYKVQFGHKPFIFLNSPEYVQKLLSSTNMNHYGKGFIYEPLRAVWKDGLVVSTGEKWKFRRRLLSKHFFSYKTILSYMQIFNEEADILVRTLGETNTGKEVGIDHLLKIAILNAIARAALGIQVSDIESVEKLEGDIRLTELISRMKEVATKRVMSPWLLFDFIWQFHPLSKVSQFISDLVWKHAKRAIAEDELANGEKNGSLKDDLLTAGVSIEGVLEETATLMSAGYETTEGALQFLLFFLASHPLHQKLCREEVDSLFQDADEFIHNKEIHYQDLAKLKHLEMCVYETLRHFPIVFCIMRKLKAPLQLEADLQLATGTEVAIYISGIHKDPIHFTNPKDFIPERFSPDENQRRHPYAFIPFSAGPRKCIGHKFAIMEMMCLTAKILRYYNISTTDKLEDIVVLPYITLTLEKPINLVFNKLRPISEP